MLLKIKILALLLFINPALAQNINSPSLGVVTGGSCSSNLFATSISTAGVPTCTQPAIANLSDASSVATLTGSQVLTNKTISGASNTLSSIANASLTNSTVTIGSTSVALGATAATVTGLTLTTPTINAPILKLASATVATLPTCNGGSVGLKYYVTDALTPVALASAVGGGAVVLSVFCNGAAWVVN